MYVAVTFRHTRAHLLSPEEGSCNILSTRNNCCKSLMVLSFKVIFNRISKRRFVMLHFCVTNDGLARIRTARRNILFAHEKKWDNNLFNRISTHRNENCLSIKIPPPSSEKSWQLNRQKNLRILAPKIRMTCTLFRKTFVTPPL